MYKRKIIIAVAALMACLILLVTASYAWLTLSSAPEVTGISTQIGANGSLEMALLNDSTFLNPALVRNLVGDSVTVSGVLASNQSWGNMVDLSDESYGLQKINLLPARLNVMTGAEGQPIVANNMLVFPEYNVDGRFQTMNTNSVSAVYRDDTFLYSTQSHGYGVRGIGTIPSISSQQSALVNARASVRSYTASAISSSKTLWKANGASVLDLYLRHYVKGENSFNDADIAVIRDTAVRMTNAVSYLDLALRQGVIGYAATMIEDEVEFQEIRATVGNTGIPLSLIVSAANVELPDSLEDWVTQIDEDRLTLQKTIYACDQIHGRTYPWEVISALLDTLFNADKTYFNEVKLNGLTSSTKVLEDNLLSLIPGAGPMSTVTEYAGAYTVFFTYEGANVEVESLTNQAEAHLVELANILDEREAVNGQGGPTTAQLTDIYGFALDFAFRCNAAASYLRLQTEATDRIETGDELSTSAGQGSFMTFSSEQMTEEQIVSLIDAVRIGFMDNQNNLLAIAKLGTKNYTVNDEGVIYAPLYLYDFSVSVDGSISMGARREENCDIVALPQGEAIVITAVVWLDGDHVDNSLAAISQKNMTGALNLQFSSSASLNPAGIGN